MKWQSLRRTELDAFDRKTPVILPTAAVEQHGEHLPLGTDVWINEAILDRLDASFNRRLLILPTQQVGCSEHHMKFPGSLTLSHEAFKMVVMDVARSAMRHGFKRLFILNSHGGNMAVNGVIGEKLGQEHPDAQVLVASWWQAAASKVAPMQEGGLGSTGHACEFETSIIQAIAPDRVDMSRAVDDGIQFDAPMMKSDMFKGAAASCYRSFEQMTPSGVYGKPSLASAEKGTRLLDAAATAIHDLITQFWPDWKF